MNYKRKLEGEIEVKAKAGDVHHEIYKSKPHHVSHAAPHFVEGCDLHEGQFGQLGSIVTWRVIFGGKPNTSKGKIVEIDEEKKLVSYACIGGDLLDEYKSISATCQVKPKDEKTCIIHWSLDYEKKDASDPEPTAFLDALISAAKDIDDHHHGKK